MHYSTIEINRFESFHMRNVRFGWNSIFHLVRAGSFVDKCTHHTGCTALPSQSHVHTFNSYVLNRSIVAVWLCVCATMALKRVKVNWKFYDNRPSEQLDSFITRRPW